MELIDGTGSGYAAKVGGDNRLYTTALLEYATEAFAHDGDAYTVPTDFISLTTTASYSGVWYIRNDSPTHNIHIEGMRTTSTVNALWQLIKNPTTGTLISAGTAVVPVNTNFSSGKTLSVVFKKGTDAQTVTDGVLAAQWMTGVYGLAERRYEGSIILGAGNSLALMCKPTASGSFGSTLSIWTEQLKR